jgi:CBS domain containing-hemolysin-like protein
MDNIIGMLQIRNIKSLYKARERLDIESLLDKALTCPPKHQYRQLLPEMSRKKINIAVVTDNYGGRWA